MTKQISQHTHNLKIEYLSPSSLIPDPANARMHSEKQIVKLAAVIEELGFTNPILIDETRRVIAGHGRLLAARKRKMAVVPVIRLKHLSSAQKRALAIADNKMSDMSTFDPELLSKHLTDLLAVDFNIQLTGFDTAEVDILLAAPALSLTDPADEVAVPEPNTVAISQPGDLWGLGDHKLLVGNALVEADYVRLLESERADMVFTDPPFNVKIQGHVSGLGKARHPEFAMASGEMSSEEFTIFLQTMMGLLSRYSSDGSIHFHCMDWRHLKEALAAGGSAYTELKALCVWNKTNGGMGSLYRSKHELVLVFKNGTAAHVNNIQLGRYGRDRTNVWDYAGVNSFRAGRDEELALHPTVKPVALVADAIRDVSKRGSLVLDPFMGSGTTILAAEKTGRRAAGIELSPHYVDTAIRRWQKLTGGSAMLADGAKGGQSFDDLAATRSAMEADHG